jgi:hypothetical protein
MDERHSTPCTLVSLLLAYALLVPSAVQAAQPVVAPPPLDAGGDDIFLIQSSVAPNVILLIDNSESMGHIEWHPAFDQTSVPTCAAFTDGTNYIAEDLALTYGFPNADEFTVTECGNTRKIYDPAKNDAKIDEALWWGRYLNWYFSDAADP